MSYVRETSLEAYRAIQDNEWVSKKRREVYNVLYHHGPLTGAQISQRSGRSSVSETVRNRLTELRNMGVVKEVDVVPCPITGRNVILWDVTKNMPTKLEVKKAIPLKRQLSDAKEQLEYAKRSLAAIAKGSSQWFKIANLAIQRLNEWGNK